jgi:putative transposase
MSNNEIITALKLIIEPDLAVAEILDGQSRICNWLYNTLLDKAQKLIQNYIQTGEAELAKTIYTERGLRNLLPGLKEENPFLKVVHSSPLKNAALRLSEAIQTHQKSKKGKRKGGIVGWPKFRSWKPSWFSLLYDEPNKGFKIEGNQLVLSLGMGEDRKRRAISIPIKDAELLKNREVRNLRIVKQYGSYFAIFSVRTLLPPKKAVSNTIALDPNHKNLAYGVDTEGRAIEIASPCWLKSYDRRIDELKGKRDSCLKKSQQHKVLDEKGNPTGTTWWEPSKRWKKYHKTLECALQKRREQTKTFLFTTAHYLYSKYDCIGIGDYTPHGNGITTPMRRAMNNRSLIGRFKDILSWVAMKSGKTFLEYNEEGTTRTCHCCRHIIENGLAPNIRNWTCPTCKNEHIRDENAAKNGLVRVLRDLSKKGETQVSQVSGSDLVSVKERWAWRVLPSKVLCILRGQNSDKIAAAGN